MLERSGVHEEPTFVLAEGHDPERVRRFAALRGVLAPVARRGGVRDHALLASLRADPFCVPQLDEFLADGEVWVEPDALTLLQEIREQHARAAGWWRCRAPTDASLHVAGLGGELQAVPARRA